jgi:hypothetical protein
MIRIPMKMAWIALVSASMAGCSHSYLLQDKKNSIEIKSVNVLAVAYHRPDYAPAAQDDFSHRDRQLSCQLSSAFWNPLTVNHREINDCLNGMNETRLYYRLVTDTQPYLEIDSQEKKNPECAVRLLPRIPLPREVYFLAIQKNGDHLKNRMGCYSSSLNVLSGTVFSTQAPKKIKNLLIPVAADRPPQTKNDLQLWLMATVFNILKADERAAGTLWALPVPDAVCRTCFQADRLFNEKNSGAIPPVFWP